MDDKQKVQYVDMNLFENIGKLPYSDDEVVVLDDVSELKRENAYLLDMLLIAFCVKGKMQMRINGTVHEVKASDMVICLPKLIVEDIMISPDFKSYLIGLSYSSVKYTMQTSHCVWNLGLYFKQNPVVPMNDEAQRLFSLYYNLVSEKIERPNKFYYKEVMHSIFQCFFFELLSLMSPKLDEKPIDGNLKQSEQLCKRFMEIITKNEGRERSVAHLAEQLCVTPKYLSTVIKSVTGKTALEWVHQVSVESIKRQLKYSNKTVKEIADDMNFPNLSFFGKFVRKHLGVSPTEYRRRLYESEK